MTKISIITVVYNAEQTISQCIESVINQDYPEIEYLVIDGGSNDGTLEKIKAFQNKITHFISEKDKGLYDAMNKGVRLATGDFVGIVNADDFLAGNHVISSLVSLINMHPTAEMICSSVSIHKGEVWDKAWRNYDATKFRLWQFRIGIQPPHPGAYIKRTLFDKVGLYNIKYRISGDFDLLLRMLYVNKAQAIYSSFISVKMRDGGLSSMGLKSKIRMNNEDLDALRKQGIYSNKILIWSKYIFKIFQLN